MGQRLNIEITAQGGTLANAYYHWSAYTGSTLHLIDQIIQTYDDLSDRALPPLELAVRLLEATGAGFNEAEKARISGDPQYAGLPIVDCLDRSAGLISVTPEGMDETRQWEEGRAIIELEDEKVWFDVYYRYDELDELPDFLDANWIISAGDAMAELNKLPVLEMKGNIGLHSFDNFAEEALALYEKSRGLGAFGFQTPDGIIVQWIE